MAAMSTLAEPFTAADYRRMPEDGRHYQVIEGILYMAPSPLWNHQQTVRLVTKALEQYLDKQPVGTLCFAPMDVYLDGENVFQPDILMVLNESLSKITPRGVMGAPDLVVEVLSPGTAKQDLIVKRAVFQRAGVKEMWFISWPKRAIEIHRLGPEGYLEPEILRGNKVLNCPMLPEFELPLAKLFAAL